MKYIFFLLFFLPISSVFAVGEQEVEQTTSIIQTIIGFFQPAVFINFIFAIVVIVLTFVISKLLEGKLFRYLERANIGDDGNKEEVIGVISRTVNIFVYIAGFSIALGILGVDLGIFMGGIGFGIGFTLRTFLTNFISGIIVVSQGSYHIGDMIEVGDKRGHITRINALFTSIEEFDGVMFNIPNVRFFEENVRNYHTNDKRRIDVDVRVEYGTDIVKAKKVLEKVITNFPMILQAPAADVLVTELGDNGVGVRLRFWIHSKEDFVTLRSNITETVNLAFQQTDITIPLPHMIVSGKLEK